jgi:hypothetical protein
VWCGDNSLDVPALEIEGLGRCPRAGGAMASELRHVSHACNLRKSQGGSDVNGIVVNHLFSLCIILMLYLCINLMRSVVTETGETP